MTYPSLLRPTTVESLTIPDGLTSITVPKVQLQFRKWEGAPLTDTFGGKPMINFAGRPVFAELCVYELFRLSGWNARWVETFGAPATHPKLLTNWLDVSRKEQPHWPIKEEWVVQILSSVAQLSSGRYSGCWDVVGLHDDTLVFSELKRLKKDRLQSTQPAWLEAGLKAGLRPENFLLIEWDFLP